MKPIILDSEASAATLWTILKGWKDALQRSEPLSVEVKPYKSKRSIEANKFYWACVNHISKEARFENGRRFSPETLHEFFKREFIGCIDLPNGGVIGMSSTNLNETEFAIYTTRVQAWAAMEHQITFEESAA